MKGSMTKSPWAIWSVIIFVALGVATIFFLRTYYVDYAAFLKTPSEKLEAIEAANAIRNCLQNGKPYATSELLAENDGKDIEDVCGFSSPSADAYVLDVETGQQWHFPSYVGSLDHAVWIPVAYQDFDEMKDTNYAIPAGEYVIYAKWFGVGTLDIRANDVMLEVYPPTLYPGNADKVQQLNYADLRKWLDEIKDGKNEGTRKVSLPAAGARVSAIIPDGYALTNCGSLGNLLSHEACVKISKGAKEIHMGRLYVDVIS